MTTARKRHACSWCMEDIEPGEPCRRSVVWADEDPETSRMHPECRDAALKMPDYARQALEDHEYWPFERMRRGEWVEEP